MEKSPGIRDAPKAWNEPTQAVLACAFEVHSALGPGLLERLYGDALEIEFKSRGIAYLREHPIRMRYKGVEIGQQVMDFLVHDTLILEIKALEHVADVHLAQLVSYLRASGFPLGLLLNFHTLRLKDGIFRRVHSPQTPIPEAMLAHPESLPPPRPSASSAFKAAFPC